ncbi:MAG: DUF5112 domain-containing protein [Prevotella sp.]|nr:DUF5112 domain-containing protein [Prevotella sp.]
MSPTNARRHWDTLPKLVHNRHFKKCSIGSLVLLGFFFFSACSSYHEGEVDRLNELSYSFHYRNLDSTRIYAERALNLAGKYEVGKAEAYNNLAFVSMAKMDYDKAYQLLDEISTDNQLELLIADIQYMRLCQRQSRNKNFYDDREKALRKLNRINEERSRLTPHQQRRLVYAISEFAIVSSTYFYYLGLKDQSIDAIANLSQDTDLEQDTAQWINYLYNIGAGGIITAGTQEEVNQNEFDYLMRCYQIAIAVDMPFFEAQALQAMSEHLQNVKAREQLIRDNLPAIRFINVDEMDDSLLAGNLALRALDIFTKYGDVYQTAGAYRTLAECYWSIHDYQSAGTCLQHALTNDTAINRAPDLVASIREQMSLVYSAVDDKVNSDFNRNIYLDLQEQTRQDRQLEARAEQLEKSSRQLNVMIAIVVIAIALMVFLILVFDRMRKRNDSEFSLAKMLAPLEEWKQANDVHIKEVAERYEEINEEIQIAQLHLLDNKKMNLEQRAKVSLVNSITPFIDRMIHEIRKLGEKNESLEQRAERYAYITELTGQINEYNDVLTRWIQMRQGELRLHIESFALQPLFDILKKGRMAFQMKGIELDVKDTSDVVKADKTLTLFMINTIADNARKYTHAGGRVTISSHSTDKYVEVSVIDTGVGMDEEQLSHLFDNKPIIDDMGVKESHSSHGFGLVNCKGIIEKYRRISQIFHVCTLTAQSKLGEGSQFSFRLPKGMMRIVTGLVVMSLLSCRPTPSNQVDHHVMEYDDVPLAQAERYVDSAYHSNVHGNYLATLRFADSCRSCLNDYYVRIATPQEGQLMKAYSSDTDIPAELQWFRSELPINYQTILSIRNETAVAALALHQWDLYNYNNKVYTQLFREWSADNTLDNYCRMMQQSENNKTVAVIILIILLVMIFPAYYLLYYRHRLYYRFCVERVNSINATLLSDVVAEAKLRKIDEEWNVKAIDDNLHPESLENVVSQIKQALRKGMETELLQQTNIELASDTLRKLEYENDKLHISNSVLDNTLSTLKHETMYYPSRIAHLVEGKDAHFHDISELVIYYKELYSMLSAQAMRQLIGFVRVDNDMLNYLFDILQKGNGGEKPAIEALEKDDKYVTVKVSMPHLQLTEEQCDALFTPSTVDVSYLLCRQIIRDIGEATNARGCGIQAHLGENGNVETEITITKNIWNRLKLSS